MRGGVLEARDLRVLGHEVRDRVEHQVDERELAVDAGAREVAERDLDVLGARLGAQPGEHRLGVVDAGDAHAALGKRQRDPAGADPELQRSAVPGEVGEHLHDRPHDLAGGHAGRALVIEGRGALAEEPRVAALFRAHPMPPPGIEPGTFGLRVRCSAS
jgi:hypothetical protein